jgi:hypothetical protein
MATACSTTHPMASSPTREESLIIDGQATQLGRELSRYVSACGPQNDGRLGMVWTGYSPNGSTDGAVTVFINGDGTVYSVSVRLNPRAGETPGESFYYGPTSEAGTAASITHHDDSHYHISGTLEGGPAAVGTQSPLQPPLHPFDLDITCMTRA